MAKPDKENVEEILFKNESAFLCMLLNRRNGFVRVIDFRAGPLPSKRMVIQDLAKKEGVRKVITLVEKDEVSSWTRVGFTREGTIPGFYKRSDGHLCGCVIGEGFSIDGSAAETKTADRTVVQAKKAAKEIPAKIRGASLSEVEPAVAEKARNAAIKAGKALNTFDNFGRDAERYYVQASVRKSKPIYLAAEFQDCFGHSLIEVHRRPEEPKEQQAITAALREMCATLKGRGIVSVFAFAPSDDVEVAACYIAAGFRKTGLLAQGIKVGEDHSDAILWTQKIAIPGEEENN